MAEITEEKPRDHYLSAADVVADREAPAWLQKVRTEGRALFIETPYPSTRIEEWKQTNINAIVNTPYQSLTADPKVEVSTDAVKPWLLGDGAWTELVFVDGYYRPELSARGSLPDGVTVCGLGEALGGAASEVVEQHLNTALQARSAYTALNSAFVQDGLFLHVQKNTVVEAPIHAVFLTSARAPQTAAHIRNLMVLETSAEAKVITSYGCVGGDGDYLTNTVDEVLLTPNAHLEHYKLVQEHAAGNHLGTTDVRLDRDAHYNSFQFTLAGNIVRNQLCTALDGEGAGVNLTGLYLNDEGRLIDNCLDLTHIKPHCNSRILYKGILDDKSKAVFTGKVYVHKEAQQTDSDQLSNNLLLSDNATIDTKPQLEIYADDVKCTHGATVGAPPEQVIFYFLSRGIDEATARGMLTYGFAGEIVSEVEIPELENYLNQYVYEKYSPKF
jgi:Fe-S cluster assembly protein SufD